MRILVAKRVVAVIEMCYWFVSILYRRQNDTATAGSEVQPVHMVLLATFHLFVQCPSRWLCLDGFWVFANTPLSAILSHEC